MTLLTHATRLCGVAIVLAGVLSSAWAASPSAAAFHQQIVSQVEKEPADRYAVIPIHPDESARQLAQAILTGLWQHKSYQDHMQKWLDANTAPTQEELISRWFRHYHAVLLPGFEFLGDDVKKILYRLKGNKLIYTLSRADCRSATDDKLSDAMQQAHISLIAEYKTLLASQLVNAYLQELARLNAPKPGDRPLPKVMSAMAMKAFQEVKNALPPADQPILDRAFAYRPDRNSLPLPERCDEDWLVSHAIVDATTAMASILRSSVTRATYSNAFDEADRPQGASRPVAGNFKPGKAFIYKPVLLARQNVSGQVTAVLHVDAAGKLEKVAIGSSSPTPSSVTSIDGRVFSSADLMLPVLEAYYRDGSFAPNVKDGVAAPNVITVPVQW